MTIRPESTFSVLRTEYFVLPLRASVPRCLCVRHLARLLAPAAAGWLGIAKHIVAASRDHPSHRVSTATTTVSHSTSRIVKRNIAYVAWALFAYDKSNASSFGHSTGFTK